MQLWKVHRSCPVELFPPAVLWQLVLQIMLARNEDIGWGIV